ncbi:NAD-dependent epimerase/dehydratase family protein [Sphingobium sp. CR28]|uniref:NAD-dependent epimerase/dehydratase family protein n=1 Tax=Sphingobium sp. CR28 TaxID=3400272 RepID=UPI003FEEEBEE
MMTILLTGATGLVGERLLARLVEAGMTCRALVRAGKTITAGATAFEGDLFDHDALAQAVDGVSAVVHLAAVFRTADTDLIWKSNLEGTQNLIGAVKVRAPDARFIMASNAHVYGRSGSYPGRENDIVDPQQAYPASKVAAERALQDSGLAWSVLRFPFVYGDGDGHLEALPSHLSAFAFHPAQRMSTVHHRDIAGAVKLALAGAFDGQIVNICDDAATTIYELVRFVGKDMDASSEPMPDPWHLHVDGSLARNLGFRPSVRTVREAIELGLM